MPTPLDQAREALALAEANMNALREAADAAGLAWDTAIRELGPEPKPCKEPSEPVAPVRTRPTPEQLAAAQALVASYPTAKALHERYAADRDRLDARVTETAAAQTEAEATAGRISATLAAAKSVPTAIARERVAQLGLPDGIAVTFPEVKKNRPVIEVLLDGRPWLDPGSRRYRGISSGREVAADLQVRAMMRRLAGERFGKVWAALPLGVDDAVLLDAGGALPDVGGPVIVLRTTATGELGVAGG